MTTLDEYDARLLHCTALALLSAFGSLLTDYGLLICFVFLAILVTVLLLWGLATTGHVDRKYSVLNASDQIDVTSRYYTIAGLAMEYQPIIYQGKDLGGPVPIEAKYEAVLRGDEILIVYHVCWENEIHPVPIVDFLYRLFRILYYGSTMDTEFVEIWINRSTGDISKVFFETELNSNPKVFFPSHTLAKVYREADAAYMMQIHDKKVRLTEPIADGRRLKIAVLTWNHEFTLCGRNGAPSYKSKLSMLTNDQYRVQKFVRRSAHALKTGKSS